ncbi:MAG: hypothetical protein AAB329_06985 [Pseudomonadota bacterium]
MKLEKYNQIIWAVIGSGTILLVAIGVVIALVSALFFGRDRGVPVEVVEGEGTVERATAGTRHDFCIPISIPDSPYQLIRVTVDRVVVKGGAVAAKGFSSSNYDEAPLTRGCGYSGSGETQAIGNILARHTGTGQIRPILQQNAVIHTLEYPSGRAERTDRRAFPPSGVLYWEIAFADSNGDGRIDEYDDFGAYLSDVDGRNFKRITPGASRVLEKVYDEPRGTLYLKILYETTGDKSLDRQDGTALIEVNVQRREIVRTVVNREQLRGLLRPVEMSQTR